MDSNGTRYNDYAFNRTKNCWDDDCQEQNGIRSSPDRSADPPSGWLIFVLVVVMVFASMLLVFVILRRTTFREHLMMRPSVAPAATTVAAASVKKKVTTEAELQQRYKAIEQALINKTVMAHDDVCASLSHTERDEEFVGDNECPICFDPLEVGDVVSFSRDDSCRHVFHHKCLKEWLIANKDCPVCRTELLPWESPQAMGEEKKGGARRVCFYCVEHQVVVLNDRDLPSEMEETLIERGQVVPDASVLLATRSKFERC